MRPTKPRPTTAEKKIKHKNVDILATDGGSTATEASLRRPATNSSWCIGLASFADPGSGRVSGNQNRLGGSVVVVNGGTYSKSNELRGVSLGGYWVNSTRRVSEKLAVGNGRWRVGAVAVDSRRDKGINGLGWLEDKQIPCESSLASDLARPENAFKNNVQETTQNVHPENDLKYPVKNLLETETT